MVSLKLQKFNCEYVVLLMKAVPKINKNEYQLHSLAAPKNSTRKWQFWTKNIMLRAKFQDGNFQVKIYDDKILQFQARIQ